MVEQHVLVKWAKYLTSFSSGNKRTIVCGIPDASCVESCWLGLWLFPAHTELHFHRHNPSCVQFSFFFNEEKTNISSNISREVCQRCKIKSRQQSMFIYKSVFVSNFCFWLWFATPSFPYPFFLLFIFRSTAALPNSLKRNVIKW